MHKILKLN